MKEFSLSRNERVKRKKDFENIFSSGKILFSTDHQIKSIFLIEYNVEKSSVKMAAAVSKKAGKAVWRNRVKRLIKEVYRHNKQQLLYKVKEEHISLMIIFSANRLKETKQPKVKLSNISPGIVELIDKIYQQI